MTQDDPIIEPIGHVRIFITLAIFEFLPSSRTAGHLQIDIQTRQASLRLRVETKRFLLSRF